MAFDSEEDPFGNASPMQGMADEAVSPLGEIIESSTTRFRAQCPRALLHNPPALGAYIKVQPPGTSPFRKEGELSGTVADPFADPTPNAPFTLPARTPDNTIFGLVFAASTGSAELGRHPSAYGLEEAQLHEEQPQIFDLLATEFLALPVGYARNGRVDSHLPPRPPRLHAFVWACSPAEVCALTDSPDFLRPLLALPGETNPDDLIVASLRQGYQARGEDFAFLVRAGKQLATLLRHDPERLTALLRSLEP